MNVLTKVADFFTGGIGETILDGVKAYFPPSMTDTEKATMRHGKPLKQRIKHGQKNASS